MKEIVLDFLIFFFPPKKSSLLLVVFGVSLLGFVFLCGLVVFWFFFL